MFLDHFSSEELKELQANLYKSIVLEKKVFSFLKNLWIFNFSQIGFAHLAEEIFTLIKENYANLKDGEITELLNQVLQDKAFKKHARASRGYENKSRMSFQYSLLAPYLNEAKTFLDYGCGKMATIRKICKENNTIEKLYGFDPKSLPEEYDFDVRAEYISDLEVLNKIEKVDLIYSSFVFHHLTEEEITTALETIKNTLHKKGKVVFLEESFYAEGGLCREAFAVRKLIPQGFKMQKELNEQFESMTVKERFLAIYLNDVLINLRNLGYMPWTFQYRTVEEWKLLFEQNGMKVAEEYFFGVVESGRMKQGITSMLVCELLP